MNTKKKSSAIAQHKTVVYLDNAASTKVDSSVVRAMNLFETKRFIEAGGYPEGNIYEGGPGRIDTPFIKSGDDYFFHADLDRRRVFLILLELGH